MIKDDPCEVLPVIWWTHATTAKVKNKEMFPVN